MKYIKEVAEEVIRLITDCKYIGEDEQTCILPDGHVYAADWDSRFLYQEAFEKCLSGYKPIEVTQEIIQMGFPLNWQGPMKHTLLHFFLRHFR